MQKIISLFQRNYDGDRLVRDEVVPGAEWVIAGEGVATRKYDGTCCLIRGGKLYKRHEVKPGGKPPPNFEAANEVDENTGKQQGWVPVGDGPEDRYHREAWEYAGLSADELAQGTCELVGPKIQGNPEHWDRHFLVMHCNAARLPDCPRDFAGIRDYLRNRDIEGVVWHHPDGRMVKIKARDFGIKRCGSTPPPAKCSETAAGTIARQHFEANKHDPGYGGVHVQIDATPPPAPANNGA